ncbi:hypothetical protein CA3LBN_003665 [Candidozyma haemuli]|uniref:Ribosomal RNA-processing protein 8 n=1 Tax=Candidozyma haemuli TaxID=45357 RepID=A0ABX8I8C2_9ASCO|nr:hypothetical protein CA3LBN_003665 [[Candida] haemuloni]
MSLFEVKGWNLKADKIAVGGTDKVENKKSKKKEKKEKKRKLEQEAKANTEDEPEEEKPKKQKVDSVKESKKDVPEKKSKRGEKQEDSKPAEPSKEDQFITKEPASERKLTPLQQKMMAKLSGSRFRWINEQLYTTTSDNALKLVKEQPALFDEYHEGFRSQVQSWPENPVDVFVDQFKARTTKPVNAPGGLPGLSDKSIVIADMGCGEAQLALDIQNFVKQHNQKSQKKKGKFHDRNGPARTLKVETHSFDLKKANDRITVADIKNVPMEDESCSIVVFCLALMGTNFLDFVEEAYRILAPNGELWIAEIKSRFTESTNAKTRVADDVGSEFVESLKLLGFFHKKTDNDNKMFTRFEFFKPSKEIIEQRKAKLEKKKRFIEQETKKEELDQKRKEKAEGEWLLKPCIYKRR